MEMDAIKKFYGTVNGVLAAMKAGVDLVFVSQTPALAAEAMQMPAVPPKTASWIWPN